MTEEQAHAEYRELLSKGWSLPWSWRALKKASDAYRRWQALKGKSLLTKDATVD